MQFERANENEIKSEDSKLLNKDNDSHMISAGNQEPKSVQTEKHWLWDNWILLAILAALSYSACNIFISELSDMGAESLCFFSSGSLLGSIIYFVTKREWNKLNKI